MVCVIAFVSMSTITARATGIEEFFCSEKNVSLDSWMYSLFWRGEMFTEAGEAWRSSITELKSWPPTWLPHWPSWRVMMDIFVSMEQARHVERGAVRAAWIPSSTFHSRQCSVLCRQMKNVILSIPTNRVMAQFVYSVGLKVWRPEVRAPLGAQEKCVWVLFQVKNVVLTCCWCAQSQCVHSN